MSGISIHNAFTSPDIDTVRELLSEYGFHLKGTLGAENMDVERFERELTTLPAPYEVLLLAFASDEAAGCALLKRLPNIDENACELKRLWVRSQFRRLGIGRKLTEAAVAKARERGYTAMYLDTVPAVMGAANRLYIELGFEPVERYNDNPVRNVTFFRRTL